MLSREELARLSTDEIIRRLQARGHRGTHVGEWTIYTPGGATRIHALTHAWAQYPGLVETWTPEDIQLMHELAVRKMLEYGFVHDTPIEPDLEKWKKTVVPSYDPLVWDAEPAEIRLRFDPTYGAIGIVDTDRGPLIFQVSGAQWRKLKKKIPGRVRIYQSQVLKWG